MLVDTSVWIDFLRAEENEPVEKLRAALARGELVGLTGMVFQEILQGADSEERYEEYRDYFGGQTFFHPRDPIDSYADAALLYFACRRQGVTVRSTADCLIAQIAIENEVLLLHNDRDFDRIAEVIPELVTA